MTVEDVLQWMRHFAPLELAEEWDNVGLLVGDAGQPVERVMTCLTVTDGSADEAVARGAELVVTHHPMPFRPLKRLTNTSAPGRLLLKLIRAGICVYSPHTAFDSCGAGINSQLAEGIGLVGVEPLVPTTEAEPSLGTGRLGRFDLPITLADLGGRLKKLLNVQRLQRVGAADHPVRRVAVGCGSAGELLATAIERACDCMVLGETRWHTCVEAEASGIALLMPGHYASERFAVEHLADQLGAMFPDLEVWASRQERDPLEWL